jgi:hypothetical protein
VAEAQQTFLLVASHHLGGLAALHAAPEVLFSPAMLVRAVIENCAHATWVLYGEGPDPDARVAAERRLARAYLEDLLSTEEAKKNAGRMGDKRSQTYLEAKSEFDRLRAEVLARFPQSTRADLGNRTLLSEKLPRPEDAVVGMYLHFEKALGSSIDSVTALGIYGFLSNMTHPTMYPARQLRVWVEDDGHQDHLTTNLTLDSDFLHRQASAGRSGFLQHFDSRHVALRLARPNHEGTDRAS